MTSWKRHVVNALTKPFGLILAHKGLAWELMEPEQLERFLAVFKVDCVFDVGANVGQYATRLREIGFRGLIVSFEPNPDAAEVLREAAADDDRWIVQELALDEQSRPLTFNIMRSSQFSSLHDPDHSHAESLTEFELSGATDQPGHPNLGVSASRAAAQAQVPSIVPEDGYARARYCGRKRSGFLPQAVCWASE